MRIHNLSAYVLCLTALLLSGCAADPKPAIRSTPLESQSEPLPEKPATALNPVLSKPTKPTEEAPASPIVLPAPVAVPPQNIPTYSVVGESWLDLSRWCRSNDLVAPIHLSGAVPRWDLHLPGGTLEIVGGNHFAHWNGMLIGLGFAPQPTHEGLQVYGVDLDKNILPLTAPFSFKTPEKILVLDPGHGGINGGTQSPSTHQIEKNLTLDWALRVQRMLVGTGWTVLLTRTNDLDLTLAQRIAFADEVQPDLFVSLHFNAMARSSKSHEEAGVETYCLTPAGLPSNITRDFEDDPTKVFPNNQFDLENLRWAIRFQQQILTTTGAHDRGVRRARFMGVLREQRRPAVLIEGGYLSDPHESKLLASAAYREKLAWAVAAVIAKQ